MLLIGFFLHGDRDAVLVMYFSATAYSFNKLNGGNGCEEVVSFYTKLPFVSRGPHLSRLQKYPVLGSKHFTEQKTFTLHSGVR